MAGALDNLLINPSGMVVLDVGASTGGFTDCLLQRGAIRSYALDVGRGQIHNKLVQDPRVVVIEGVNARNPFYLPDQVDMAVADVSFISLRLVVPEMVKHLKPGGHLLLLVKPQFEAERGEVGRGGLERGHHRLADRLGIGHGARRIVEGYGLPARVPGDAVDAELLDAMGRDKKAVDGLTFALDGPDGVEVVAGVQESLVEQVLACVR